VSQCKRELFRERVFLLILSKNYQLLLLSFNFESFVTCFVVIATLLLKNLSPKQKKSKVKIIIFFKQNLILYHIILYFKILGVP
jgi:hypothetical protein